MFQILKQFFKHQMILKASFNLLARKGSSIQYACKIFRKTNISFYKSLTEHEQILYHGATPMYKKVYNYFDV